MYTCNDAWLHIIRIYNRFARSRFQNLVCNIHLVSPNQASRLHSIRPRHLYSVIIPPMTVLGRKLYRSYESMARHLRHVKPTCALWMDLYLRFRHNCLNGVSYTVLGILYRLYDIVCISYFVHLNRLRSIFRLNLTDWGM